MLFSVRATGANAPETSFYPALSTLFNEVGRHLKPKVRCVMGLKDQGAGMPDGGLFTESQFKRRDDHKPLPGQSPERGVIEVKPVGTDVNKLVAGDQVARYWSKYRLILVTDLREFVLLGEESGVTVVRERHTLAKTPKEFWELARHPQKAAKEEGERFVEFLQRVMLHAAPLTDPRDVAWFLASYLLDGGVRAPDHYREPLRCPHRHRDLVKSVTTTQCGTRMANPPRVVPFFPVCALNGAGRKTGDRCGASM